MLELESEETSVHIHGIEHIQHASGRLRLRVPPSPSSNTPCLLLTFIHPRCHTANAYPNIVKPLKPPLVRVVANGAQSGSATK